MNSSATLQEGELIDRYRVICEVASGGMATVFLAHRGGLGGFNRLVAIKRLHPHLGHEQQFVDMFLDEARLVAEIHHPNVVPTLDVLQTDAGLCLVMEYVEGVPLHRLLRRMTELKEPVNHAVVLRVMLDALAGLHGAHELRDPNGVLRGLVHRDVSPQNILVGTNGRSVILDFGVAHATERLTSTTVGQMKGKLAYMAPEQASGGKIDRKTDVFAAGIVLWESLAARRLFYGSNEVDTLSRVLTNPVPKLRDAAPTVPEEIEAVVMKALSRDPEQRFESCAEFAGEIEALAKKLDLLATNEQVGEYVERLAHEQLEERRSTVRDALAHAAQADDSAPSGTMTLGDHTGTHQALAQEAAAAPGLQADVRRDEGQGGGRMALFGLAGLIVVGAGIFGVSRSCAPEAAVVTGPAAAAQPAAAVEVPSAVPVKEPVEAAAPVEVADKPDAGADAGEEPKVAKAVPRWRGRWRPKPPPPKEEPAPVKTAAPPPPPDPGLNNPYR